MREHRRVVDCHVLDVSDHGARLRAPEATAYPTSFMLELSLGAEHTCETVWTSGDMPGVRFP